MAKGLSIKLYFALSIAFGVKKIKNNTTTKTNIAVATNLII